MLGKPVKFQKTREISLGLKKNGQKLSILKKAGKGVKFIKKLSEKAF